jgi:hypothetical protein
VARRGLHTEGGQHAVEVIFPERKLLGVTFDPIDVQAALGGATARRHEQLGC